MKCPKCGTDGVRVPGRVFWWMAGFPFVALLFVEVGPEAAAFIVAVGLTGLILGLAFHGRAYCPKCFNLWK